MADRRVSCRKHLADTTNLCSQPTVLTPKALRLPGGSVFAYVADPAELRKRASQVIAAI